MVTGNQCLISDRKPMIRLPNLRNSHETIQQDEIRTELISKSLRNLPFADASVSCVFFFLFDMAKKTFVSKKKVLFSI